MLESRVALVTGANHGVRLDHQHHHVAQPEEVAEVLAWLCCKANHLVTGNVIRLR